MREKEEIYNYGNENIFITDLLKKPEIVNYLERNRSYTPASRREKRRKLLREHGDNLRQMVTDYNLQNPPTRQRRQVVRHALRSATSESKSPTKGRVFFGPERPPRQPRRPIGVITINRENLTARQAFNRYPQLREHYQSERRLKEGTLHAKLRKDFKTGNIPHDILNEDPSQFQQVDNHFNGAHMRFKLDDQRIKFHNIPSLRE